MLEFDNSEFKRSVAQMAEERGQNRSTIINELAEMMNLSARVVAGYQKAGTHVPADRVAKLEAYFGASLRKEGKEDKISDFQRQQILDCRNLLREFVLNLDFCEGQYELLSRLLERHSPVLPKPARMSVDHSYNNIVVPLAERVDEALTHAGKEVDHGHVAFESPEEFFSVVYRVTDEALSKIDAALLPIITS